MTKLEHAAWYNGIIANIYAASGEWVPLLVFCLLALLCFGAAYFGRQR